MVLATHCVLFFRQMDLMREMRLVGFGWFTKSLDGGAHRTSAAIRSGRNERQGVQAASATSK